MTEEQLTKIILKWLAVNGWKIICFDFPQSGTGRVLHPTNRTDGLKNKGSFIPDIVAVKNGKAVFFENKDHFSAADILKIQSLRQTNDYRETIEKLLDGHSVSQIFYGVGLPDLPKTSARLPQNQERLDFWIAVGVDVQVLYQTSQIFP